MKRMLAGILTAAAVCSLWLAAKTPADLPADPDEYGTVSLPEIETPAPGSLEDALFRRRSVRSYASEPLTAEEIGALLWAAAGETVDGTAGPTRAHPSAGGLYPVEVFLAVGEAEGIDPGVYRYSWHDHQLIEISSGDIRSELMEASLNQNPVLQAPVTVILSAVYSRTMSRYGERGERYVHMDAGAAGQNVQLQAAAAGLHSVIIGAFEDDSVRNLIGGTNAQPLLVIPVGRPRE